MNLLLDIGNSRLKWAVAYNQHISANPPIDYRQSGYLQRLRQEWLSIEAPWRVAIACVAAKSVLSEIIELIRSLWPGAAIVIPHSAAQAFGVKNVYTQPEKLGIDRWLTLIAAHRHYSGPACIIDCGTAITVDALAADGSHLGGLICPGLILMQKALSTNTADLDFVSIPGIPALAVATDQAIANGALLASVGLIESINKRLDASFRLVLTGGDAEIVASALQRVASIDRDLVFKGLAVFCQGDDLP